MTNKADKKNRGGRPRHYEIDQVRDVVEAMIRSGVPLEEINAKTVKAGLCDGHGVSAGINEQSLEEPVQHVLDELAEEERAALIDALPSAVAPAVDQVLDGMKDEILLIIARQNLKCQERADRECEALRQDKKNANWRVKQLEAEAAGQVETIRELEQAQDDAAAQLAATREELKLARAELESRGREAGTIDRLLAELRDPAVRIDIRTALTEIVAEPVAEAQSS